MLASSLRGVVLVGGRYCFHSTDVCLAGSVWVICVQLPRYHLRHRRSTTHARPVPSQLFCAYPTCHVARQDTWFTLPETTLTTPYVPSTDASLGALDLALLATPNLMPAFQPNITAYSVRCCCCCCCCFFGGGVSGSENSPLRVSLTADTMLTQTRVRVAGDGSVGGGRGARGGGRQLVTSQCHLQRRRLQRGAAGCWPQRDCGGGTRRRRRRCVLWVVVGCCGMLWVVVANVCDNFAAIAFCNWIWLPFLWYVSSLPPPLYPLQPLLPHPPHGSVR